MLAVSPEPAPGYVPPHDSQFPGVPQFPLRTRVFHVQVFPAIAEPANRRLKSRQSVTCSHRLRRTGDSTARITRPLLIAGGSPSRPLEPAVFGPRVIWTANNSI